MFAGLTKLNTLNLSSNPGAPFTLTAELEQQGDAAVVVKVAEGAPFDLTVQMWASGGTLDGDVLSRTSVTVPAGSLASAPVTVSVSGSQPEYVTVGIRDPSFPPPANNTVGGIALAVGSTVFMTITPPPMRVQLDMAPSVPKDTRSTDTRSAVSSVVVEPGTAIAVIMSFHGLEQDSNQNDIDYIFRADVLDSNSADADACEDQAGGYGLGVDRYMRQVDEDPEVRRGAISADCPAGSYTLRASLLSPDNVELATSSAAFTVGDPPLSTDATLSGLTLSGVNIGTFDPATIGYTASVVNDVTETTVTATANDNGATYVVKLGGTEDADGTVGLAVGDNAVSVEVTAEDGQTTKTYTVTVTRTVAPPPFDDATLSGLSLSGVNFGKFNSATTQYTASVGNDVTETTVTATANDSGATYVVKLDGVEDVDRTVALAVGANVITVEVTAEDGQTTRTYRVTVTRAEAQPPVNPAPHLTARFEEAPQSHDGTNSFTFHIAFSEDISVSFVTIRDHALEVTGGNVTGAWRVDSHSDLWGIRVQPDSDADVEIALPANRACDTQGAVCTEDDKVLSNRPKMTIPGPAPVNSPASGAPTISGTAQVGQTLTASTSGIADADGLTNATFSYQWTASDGTTDTDITGATAATYTLLAADEGKTVKVRVTFTDDGGNGESLTSVSTGPVAPPPSNDATLSNLTLSGINFGTFASAIIQYTANVANDVTETTVTPTANDGGATYVVKLDGVEDVDRTVALAVGANTITVEVTAEDGQTTRTYRVTVTRAEAQPPVDPTPHLTARFEEAPQSHDGTNSFTFHIAFSEDISVSFVTIRDHALEVTGGNVTGAWRVDSHSDLWGIRVQPDSDADVEIALPANRACDTQGAVCTEDDKVLPTGPR